jgi:FixJ family two-component response regulator
MEPRPTLAIIDDDASFRDSLARVVKLEGYRVIHFASADDFLADPVHEQVDCALLDIQMPGLDGLELQKQINEVSPHVSIVFLTGHAGIPESVHAMKAGAVDFLEKPIAEKALFAAIRHGIERNYTAKAARNELSVLERKYRLLTPREREVFALGAAGLLNKQIAFGLGTTERTIKAHRRHVMDKFEAESLAHLVRIADRLGIERISKEQRDIISGRRVPTVSPSVVHRK